MSKQTLAGNEAREALMRGLDKVANVVKVTLGPRGRNVLLDRPGQPIATRDGVTCAKEMANLPDPFEQMGALYAREVADAAVTLAGDGTTTGTVILQAIVREGLKLVSAGAEPLLLAEGIQQAASACAETIKKLAVKATPELVRQAAIISTHGDVELGSMIAEATCKVGVDGVLELKESRDEKTSIEHVEGYHFGRGWRPYDFFARDHRKCVLQKPLILLSERVIVGTGAKQLANGQIQLMSGDGIGTLLHLCIKAQRPLLIIAEELTGDALSTFAANAMNGQLVGGGCFVKLPGLGEQRVGELEDLRIAVGAARVHSQTSRGEKDQLSSFTLEDLGWCETAVISDGHTSLIGGGANSLLLEKRVKELNAQAKEADNPWLKANLEARIARLTGGVAVLRVGGYSEPSMLERKARAEDAVHTSRGALQEGLVPGGGIALLRAVHAYKPELQRSQGEQILLEAMREPARQIIRNAGFAGAEKAVEALEAGEGWDGFNAATGEHGDLLQFGIVDPTKVVLVALAKAASIGALLLTTEVLVADLPEKKA